MRSAHALRIDDDEHRQPTASALLHVVVEGMVGDVSVQYPFPGHSRRPYHIISLPRTYIDHVRLKSRRGREDNSVARDNRERAAVHVHRVKASHGVRTFRSKTRRSSMTLELRCETAICKQ